MVVHRATEAAISNMFGHTTEQPRDFWSKRDATSCNLSTNSNVDTASISTASIHLQNKNKYCSIWLSLTHTSMNTVHVHTDNLIEVLISVFMFFTALRPESHIFSVKFFFPLVFEDPHVQNKRASQFHGLLLAVFYVLKFKSGLSSPLSSD